MIEEQREEERRGGNARGRGKEREMRECRG